MWINIMERLFFMMARLGKHHYRDAIIITLSRLHYWQENDHPMAKELFKFLPHFSEVLVEIFFSVLSAHTGPAYSAEQIREAAIWVDEMKEENTQINETYLVRKLDYHTNITPSSSVKHTPVVSKTSLFVKLLFQKAVTSSSSTFEETSTYDGAGLLSYRTALFGMVPAHLFPLPFARPSSEVVCSGCKKQLKGTSRVSCVRHKCGHAFHQLCLLPDTSKLKPKQMYKSELQSLCTILKLITSGLKKVLVQRVEEFIRTKPSPSLSCPGCEEQQPTPTTRKYCHICKEFIEDSSNKSRLPCGHIVHLSCFQVDECPICKDLVREVVEETSKRAILRFTNPEKSSSSGPEPNSDSEDDDDEDAVRIIPHKQIDVNSVSKCLNSTSLF